MKQSNKATSLGFESTDGFFQQLTSLKTHNLEFVSKSRLELEDLLKQSVLSEHYEKCAAIRDELLKRKS